MKRPRQFAALPHLRYRPEVTACPHCGSPLRYSHPVWAKPIQFLTHTAHVTAADVTQNLADNRQHLANVLTNFNAILGTIAANDPGFRKFIHQGNLSLGHGLT